VITLSSKLVPSLLDLIKYYEGLYLEPYRDPVGLWTVGWGHLISLDKTLPKPPTITCERAEQLLASDLAQTATLVHGALKRDVEPFLFSALVDFTFNLGIGNLRASTLLRKVNRGEQDESLIREFRKWDKAGGRVMNGLVKRRAGEVQLLLTGGFDPTKTNYYIDLMRNA
jgi:lysozyme